MAPVVLLEDDDDLRDTLELALEGAAGVQLVHSCRSTREVIALGRKVLGCSCAVLDVNLGKSQPSGIDAARWLRETGYTGQIIFLTGHAAAYPQLKELTTQPKTALLEKPAPLPRLFALVQGSSA